MKRTLTIIITAMALFCSSCTNNDKLIGKWVHNEKIGTSEYTFNPDGSFSSHYYSNLGILILEFWGKGKYIHKGDSIILDRTELTQATNGKDTPVDEELKKIRIGLFVVDLDDGKLVVKELDKVKEYSKQ